MMPLGEYGGSPLDELTDEERRRLLEAYAPGPVSTGPMTRGVALSSPSAPSPSYETQGTQGESEQTALMRRFAEAQSRGNSRDTVNAWASGVGGDVANFVNAGSYGRGNYRNTIERDPSLRTREVNDLKAQEAVKTEQGRLARQGQLDAVNLDKTRAETAKAQASAASTAEEAKREAALADPKSAESAALRATATELLKGRVTPETLSTMSGVQIRDALKYGTSQINAETMAQYRSDALGIQNENADRDARLRAWAIQQGIDFNNATLEQRERLAKYEAELRAAQAAKEGANRVTDQESKLRTELQNLPPVKEYQLAAIGLDKVRTAAKDPSAAGDLALIFGYMKTLDPTSTVREGEFANAQNATGIPERVQNIWNKALTGERLAPAQRAEFISSAEGQFSAYKHRADALIGGYRRLAIDSGLNPDRIILDGTMIGQDAPTPPPAPTGQKSSLTPPAPSTQPKAAPAPAVREISVKGMQPGDLAKSLQDGETVRIKETGKVVRKRGAKLVVVTVKE